ncbi:hypothetical protein TYRP_001933 [Tyrophagus putrescentiae]|nr:hypothetical protein TYRP_001933 [Tyrophagus putrescentiae]
MQGNDDVAEAGGVHGKVAQKVDPFAAEAAKGPVKVKVAVETGWQIDEKHCQIRDSKREKKGVCFAKVTQTHGDDEEVAEEATDEDEQKERRQGDHLLI